ncbi:MAG: VOC family protein [Clostridiales bacterium]|jgi:lactoylglutathione lyase|nr:VOC family protein [Clostridiales bacterium]
MNFKLVHNNLNVTDLPKSLEFYEKALGLKEVKRSHGNGFTIVFLQNANSSHCIELTWLLDHPQKYDLGENEIHIAFTTDDYDAAHKLHEQMGCICFENPGMGLYFIEDPDGYWLEIVPQ